MNKTNIRDYRRMLEAKRAEILSSHHDTEGIAIERVPDSTEEFSLEVQRSMAVDALDRQQPSFARCQKRWNESPGGNMACA